MSDDWRFQHGIKAAEAMVSDISEASGPYKRFALSARAEYLTLRMKQDAQIVQVYIDAINIVSSQIKILGNGKGSDIYKAAHMKQFQQMLIQELNSVLKQTTQQAIEIGSEHIHKVTVLQLKDVRAIEIGMVNTLFVAVNTQAIEAFWARSRHGLVLSDRIWATCAESRKIISSIIQAGIATGMDAVQVARALEVYAKGGATTLAKQYPNMMKRMGIRIPGDICYEALRLARTEMTSAFGEGVIASGRVSPGYEGVKWALSASHPKVDICDMLASGGPQGDGVYPRGQEPMYPAHPNDLCALVPRMVEPSEMVNRLNQWIKSPATQPDLEGWYQKVYLPTNKS